jgi:hypothetical protein
MLEMIEGSPYCVSMSGTSRLARIARLTAKIVASLVAVLVLVAVVLFIANSFDVPLSEKAKALLTPPPNPYPPDENIYLAMAGMEGPSDRPIVELGQERIDAYNKALDSAGLDPDRILSLDDHWGAGRLKSHGKLELGAPRSSSIWTNTKTHREEIAAMLAANQQLYQRYLSLHYFRGYYETARPSYMAPLVFPSPQIRTVFLSDVANRIQTATPQQQREALQDLQQDLQLWRNVLKGDGTLISKMLSVAFLHGDMILLADLVTDPSFDLQPLEDFLDPMFLPFDPKDFAIGNAFAAEFRSAAPIYKTIASANEMPYNANLDWWPRLSNAFQAHFFQLNATENANAAIAARWVAVGDSQPSEFQQARQAQRQWLDKEAPHLSPNFVYNPVGKILISLADVRYEDYFLRAYDVAAYQRLVYLAFQIKRQHIATTNVASFVKVHPDWSTHPVDGRPFLWTPETSELAVNTLGPNPKEQRFGVILR